MYNILVAIVRLSYNLNELQQQYRGDEREKRRGDKFWGHCVGQNKEKLIVVFFMCW